MTVPVAFQSCLPKQILPAFQPWGGSSNVEMEFLTCETNRINYSRLNMYLSVHLGPVTLLYYNVLM